MKKIIFSGILICSCFFSFAQTLENVFSEQDGDKIIIYYTISDAKPGQTFDISVSCSTENKRFVLKSVSGDVGPNITPGANKKIIWDVLKDVDQLGSAKFFVKIEKINEAVAIQKEPEIVEKKEPVPVVEEKKKEEPAKPEVKKEDKKADKEKKENIPEKLEQKIYLAYSPGIQSALGYQMGSLGRFGFYSSIRLYNLSYNNNKGFSIMIGPQIRIFKRFYLYAGFGSGRLSNLIPKGDYDFQGNYVGYQMGEYAYQYSLTYVGMGDGDLDENGNYVGAGMGAYSNQYTLSLIGSEKISFSAFAIDGGAFVRLKRLTLGLGVSNVGTDILSPHLSIGFTF